MVGILSLAAAIRYADVEDADSVIVIAQSLDVFVFAKGIYDDYELGEYWIDKVDEYTYSPELQDYIDFEECNFSFAVRQKFYKEAKYIQNNTHRFCLPRQKISF